MKARVYLSVGALLLFLAPLGCSDKAESPAPETPPEEQPVQPSAGAGTRKAGVRGCEYVDGRIDENRRSRP